MYLHIFLTANLEIMDATKYKGPNILHGSFGRQQICQKTNSILLY
jgi:hypothetical protein